MTRIAPIPAPTTDRGAMSAALERTESAVYCSSRMEDPTVGSTRTTYDLALPDALAAHPFETATGSDGLSTAPKIAPAFDLLRNSIVGNGHRAKRYARMNAPDAVDEHGEPLGKYTTVHKPLSDTQLRAHLAGQSTYAAIIIGADGLVSGGCIEVDRDGMEAAARILLAAKGRGITMFAGVVKGAGNHYGPHCWALYNGRYTPEHVAAQLRQVAEDAGYGDAEIWPKGNAIRLPFGVHTHSGSRGRLLVQSGLIYELDDADDLDAGTRLVAKLPLNEAPPAPPKPEPKPIKKVILTPFSGTSPIEQFNADHTIADLLLSYGATQTRDGWACNCGYDHSHATQLQVTSQGKLVSYSPNCRWAPHYTSGKAQDAFGLYCHVEHGGNVQAAVAALLPEKKSSSRDANLISNRLNGGLIEPRYTQDQREAWAKAKNAQNAAAAADLHARIRAQLAADDRLIPCDRVVCGVMVDWMEAHHATACTLGRASIARLSGYSLGAVKRAVMHLEALGYFESVGDGGRPIDTARRNFSRGSCFATRNSFVSNDDPRIDISRDLIPDPVLASERAAGGEPDSLDTWEWQADQHGADELNAVLCPEIPDVEKPDKVATQPADRMAQVEAIEAMTDDELRAWMAGLSRKSEALPRSVKVGECSESEVLPKARKVGEFVNSEELPDLQEVGASYDPNLQRLQIPPDPRAVPSWLRQVGDIGPMVRREEDACEEHTKNFLASGLPDPEPEIRCPPSDPAKSRRYYAIKAKAKQTTNAAQRRKLDLLAYNLEEWRRVGDAPRLTSPPAQAPVVRQAAFAMGGD